MTTILVRLIIFAALCPLMAALWFAVAFVIRNGLGALTIPLSWKATERIAKLGYFPTAWFVGFCFFRAMPLFQTAAPLPAAVHQPTAISPTPAPKAQVLYSPSYHGPDLYEVPQHK